jgi:hypothetical protein
MYIDPKILEEMQKRQQQQNRFAVQEPRRINSFFARGGGFTPDQAQQEALKRGFFETQADANTYEQQQRNARNVGLGNMLYSLSDAFAGRNIGAEAQTRQANTLAMQQAQEATNERARQEQQRVSLNEQIDQLVLSGQMSEAMGEYAKSDPSILGEIYKSQLPGQQKAPTSYQEYALTDPTPTNEEYAQFLANKQSRSATQINMPAIESRMGIEYAYDVLTKGDQRLIDNQNVTDRLYLIDTILDDPDFETGAMTEALLPIKSWLVEFGGKTDAYVENLGAQQLFDALSSYIVPRMRAVGSGATSDFEADLYQKAIASLGKTKEANRLIVKFMLATTERDRKMLELQKRYVAEHAEILGFNAALRDENSGYVEAELFRKFDMETNEDTGATDFQQAVANGDIKEGDLYYDRKAKKMRIYGSEPIPDPFPNS